MGIFIVLLFTIIKRPKELTCPAINEGLSKLWSIHTMKYYLYIKGNKVLIHATTWKNLKNTLYEKSQTQKSTYCIILFI
jgi:hypothetical protein